MTSFAAVMGVAACGFVLGILFGAVMWRMALKDAGDQCQITFQSADGDGEHDEADEWKRK